MELYLVKRYDVKAYAGMESTSCAEEATLSVMLSAPVALSLPAVCSWYRYTNSSLDSETTCSAPGFCSEP